MVHRSRGTSRSAATTVILTTAAGLALLPLLAAGETRTYSLEEAFQAAIGTYEVVRIAREDVVQSESRVEQAWSYVYPRVLGRGGFTRYNDTLPENGEFLFQPLREVRAEAVLSQPLYTGGRTLAAYRYALGLREASTYGLAATTQDTLLRVAEAYYDVLRTQKLVDVSTESLRRMERFRAITQREARTRRTRANESALLRANTLVSQAHIILTRSEERLRIARKRLSSLTGFPPDAALSEPAPAAAPRGSVAELRQIAYTTRDELAAARIREMAATENITIVRGGHLPQVSAEGGVQYRESSPETPLDETVYYGGVRITIPLFEGGLMKAEVAEARSKLRQAELATALLRKTIDDEVYEAVVNVQTVTAVLEASQAQYEDARANFAAVESLFTEGITPTLNVIDAQQALFVAEREYVNALYDRQIAIVKLRRALGVLGKEPS